MAAAGESPARDETAARLAEFARTTAWADNAARFAEAMKTTQWQPTTPQLAEAMRTTQWHSSLTQLAEAMKTSEWMESVSSIATVLDEHPVLVEAFADSVGVEIEGPTAKADGSVSDNTPRQEYSQHKAGLLLTFAIYLAAAIALHISNFLSTTDPVFDLHQLITDQFIAISTALTFYCAFWKD